MYSPGIAILYDSTHASIPSGWSRATNYDGKFLKGAAAGQAGGSNSGASTHSHSSSDHSHSLQDHSHSYTLDYANEASDTGGSPSSSYLIAGAHNHTGSVGSISGGTVTDALTYGSVSNNPSFYEYILIKSSGWNFLPNNGVVLSKNTSRSGLSFHSSAASRMIRIAAANQNAGTTGGSTTNIHDITHSHTPVSHTHQTAWSSISIDKFDRNGGSDNVNGVGYDDHNHKVGLTAGTQPIDTYSGSLTTTETVEPAFTTLNPFKNSSGVTALPAVGDVALWDGALASIPIGWDLCDGNNGTTDMRSRFLKVPASAAAPTTGGSNTHTHASQNHSHTTGSSHSHPTVTGTDHAYHNGGEIGENNLIRRDQSGNGGPFDQVMTHSATSISTVSSTYSTGATTAGSSSNEPEYRTVAYIQLMFQSGGGAIIKRLLG